VEAESVEHKDVALTSLVLPAYNPGPGIARTWRELTSFLRGRPESWEVIFVCDGCTDGTPERLHELSREDRAPVRILSYPQNQGKGYAVRHGLLAARGAYRLFTDVDLAYGWDDVVRVAQTLWSGAEVAIASRRHEDSKLILPQRLQGYAYRRHLQSQIFSFIVRMLLPLPDFDTQAGLKGLTARAARTVLPPLECKGFGFDCELLVTCVRQGLPVVEVPVTVRFEDVASTTGFKAARSMLAEIWQMRRRQKVAVVSHTPPADSDIAAAA